MNTLSEETPRVKSSGSSAGSSGKKRRRSIDITSSGKSSGEEVNNNPNYLRGSTDPKFPKPTEPVEVTKKDAALPSQKAQVMKRSLSTNGKAARNEPKMFQSKLAEISKSKVKALVNAFETMISASKLAESSKSKVKALVDVFETVVSLQDDKPSST
ncbi:putative calmodulin-binding domain containing protein [Tanacetum coccineum]